jgi:hypothetical protein
VDRHETLGDEPVDWPMMQIEEESELVQGQEPVP